MNGIVLMIPDTNFSSNNLGTVTILQDVAIESLSILGSSVIEESTAQYSVTCLPSVTSQTAVDWSIDSGSEYVSINSSGLLTVIASIQESVNVTIRATSVYNTTISATKTVRIAAGVPVPVTVTYTNGTRKANQNGINANYTNIATFNDESLLDWKTNIYKVTVDSSYKVYFAAVRTDSNRCGARSSLYANGTYDVSTIMDSLCQSNNIDSTIYTHFALVVVDSDYVESGATGSTVNPLLIPDHITIEQI